MDDQLQKLVELTGTDPGPQQQPQMSPGVYQILNPFFIFNNHLQSNVVMMMHITKPQSPPVMFSLYEQFVFCRATV